MPDHSERKLASVLFADLVGSTAAAGDQDPERRRARLERFYDAMAAEILAGERTVAAARGAFEFDEPMSAEAKGKAESVPCRRLVRALSLMRTRGVGELARAFVGRETQLELLLAAYRRAVAESHPVLVAILGDVGVGKTRLVRELWEKLPRAVSTAGARHRPGGRHLAGAGRPTLSRAWPRLERGPNGRARAVPRLGMPRVES